MWKIKKGQLLEIQDLGIGQVLRVYQWVEPKIQDQLIMEGNPVPHHARYTCDVYVNAEVQQVEIHVYFEHPGKVLHRSWNRIGAYEGRKSVKIIEN